MPNEADVPDKGSPPQTARLARTSWPVTVSLVAGALAVAVLSLAPFFVQIARTSSGRALKIGVMPTHDLAEHLTVMEQFDKSLRSGVLYPRWLADVNREYGNAWTNYYPPVCYYLSSAIHSIVGDWIATVALLSIMAMAGSGLAFYIFSRLFYGKAASVIAGLLYVLLPYHVLDLYRRGALPEFLGFVFLPLLMYFAFRLGSRGRLVDYAGLGLTYGLYVMTHLPVGYLMSYVLVLYAIVWSLSKRDRAILVRIGGGMALGLLVCAIYLLPAVLEARYAYEETSAFFPYNSSYLPALLALDPFSIILNHTFMLQAIALAVAVIVVRSIPLAENESESQLRHWILLGVLATIMVTAPSFYLSTLIPRTDLVAFAWRWLAISGMFTSVLVAAALDRLSSNAVVRRRRLVYCTAILVVSGVNVWFTAQSVIAATVTRPEIAGSSGMMEASYTPKGAALPKYLPDTPRIVITPEGGASELVRWDPQNREARVSVNEPSRVRFKTYSFPGWVARVDDNPSPVLSDDLGIQVVEVPEGVHVIHLSFANTPARTAGTLLSLIGWLAVIGLAALGRIKKAGYAEDAVVTGTTPRLVSFKWVAAGVFGLVVVVLIFFWIDSRGLSGGAPPAGGGTPAGAPSSATPGAEATLHLDGVASILVALDEGALNELINARAAKDTAKIEALVQDGKVLRVPNDTSVRVLGFSGGKARVRLLQGEHKMAEGLVPERWIR